MVCLVGFGNPNVLFTSERFLCFNEHFPWRSVLLATVALWLLLQPQVAAADDAIVSGACTETEFDAALATVQSSGGGTLTFACGGVKTITLTDPDP